MKRPSKIVTGSSKKSSSTNGADPESHQYDSSDNAGPSNRAKENHNSHSNKHLPARNASQLKLSMLFDPSLPWVLVENGSLGGYFDWVPVHMRVGEWSWVAIVYLTLLWYAAAAGGVYLFHQKNSIDSWWKDHMDDACQSSTTDEKMSIRQWSIGVLMRLFSAVEKEGVLESEACLRSAENYPGPNTMKWLYNTLGCLWMVFVMYSIAYQSPMGLRAWGTYTVQSWTLLTFRHGLSSLAPFSQSAALLAEILRFPAACQATVTFLVWNLALVPFIYFFAMDNEEKKQGFVKFCFSFRLVQIHLLNIVFCYLNIVWASPARELHAMDFYVALLGVLIYMMFYLMVLDRIGVHLYPIFSPRLRGTVLVSWTSVLGLYAFSYWMWNEILKVRT